MKSKIPSAETKSTNIQAINAFNDNYIWAITNKHQVTLVDPGDANVCIKFIEANKLILNAILTTHHHADHTGGIEALVDYCQQKKWPLTVYGPANESIPHCDVMLKENDTVSLSVFDISFNIIDLPGHTAGHIAYFADYGTYPIVFCGDTLFSAGCGRIFEGTPKQMLDSLTKLINLPEQTLVYCTHEYTQANLAFALTVDPNNEALINYNTKVNELRNNQRATIPSTIQLEKQINPFLRCHEHNIQHSAQKFAPETSASILDTFTTIRRWKDQF